MEHAAELKEPMNTLANIFSASEIMLDLHARDAMELFSAVGKYWENHHVIPAQKVIKALAPHQKERPLKRPTETGALESRGAPACASSCDPF